jgi:hypothetical protein
MRRRLALSRDADRDLLMRRLDLALIGLWVLLVAVVGIIAFH